MNRRARVSEKGQITIPKALRDSLGIRTGEVLELREERGRLIGTKVAAADPLEEVYGILDLGRPTDDILRSLRGEADAI